MTRRRTTPTGVLVTSAAPQTEEWYAARREGITATDVAKILGVSDQYGTALDVWSHKLGTLPEVDLSDVEPVLWGGILEDPVAREGARRDGLRIRRIGILEHDVYAWRRASLDRLVTGGCELGGRCAVEVKTRDGRTAHRWKTDVPDDVVAQVTWQMHVSGLDHVHVYCLIGGNRLERFVLRREELADVEELAVEAAIELWLHVQAETRPTLDPTPGLVDSLNRLFGPRDGDVVIPAWEAEPLVEAYREAAEQRKAAEKAVRTAQAALMQRSAGAARAVDPDGHRFWSITNVPGVDDDLLFDRHWHLWWDLAEAGFIRPEVAVTEVRDEDPELWQRLLDADLVHYSPRFTAPTKGKSS